MNGVHVSPPGAQAGTLEVVITILGYWDCLFVDVFAFYAVDEVDVKPREGRAEYHAVATICPGWQADNEDVLELRARNDQTAR